MTRLVDIEVALPDRPGALADLGETLGAAGVSLEGGGVFVHGGVGVTHFLVADGAAAEQALESAGLGPVAVNPVIMLRLEQETPGQLGTAARLMADAGVNLRAQYSDHAGSLVLVVSDTDRPTAARIAAAWTSRLSAEAAAADR